MHPTERPSLAARAARSCPTVVVASAGGRNWTATWTWDARPSSVWQALPGGSNSTPTLNDPEPADAAAAIAAAPSELSRSQPPTLRRPTARADSCCSACRRPAAVTVPALASSSSWIRTITWSPPARLSRCCSLIDKKDWPLAAEASLSAPAPALLCPPGGWSVAGPTTSTSTAPPPKHRHPIRRQAGLIGTHAGHPIRDRVPRRRHRGERRHGARRARPGRRVRRADDEYGAVVAQQQLSDVYSACGRDARLPRASFSRPGKARAPRARLTQQH